MDPVLESFQSALRSAGRPDEEIDIGCPVLNYSSLEEERVGGGDGRNDLCELLQAGFTLAPPSRAAFFRVYQDRFGEPLPWSIRGETAPSLVDLDRQVGDLEREKGSLSLQEMALAVYDWVMGSGDLAVRYDPHVETTAEELLASRQRQAACTGYAGLLIGLLGRRGLRATAVWVGVDLFGKEVQHFAVQVEVEGGTLLLDPAYASLNPRFGINPPHRALRPVSLLTLLGWHWINRGNDSRDLGDFRSADRFYDRAIGVDPQNPHAYLNRAILREREAGGREGSLLTLAREDLRLALRLDPRFYRAEYEWGNLEYDAGNFSQALVHYRLAYRLAPPQGEGQAEIARMIEEMTRTP